MSLTNKTDDKRILRQVNKVAPNTGMVMMSEHEAKQMNEIMTIEQVARYLSLHELTVRRLAREGSIPAFKVGRQWRVKRELLDKWIEREAYRNLGK